MSLTTSLPGCRPIPGSRSDRSTQSCSQARHARVICPRPLGRKAVIHHVPELVTRFKQVRTATLIPERRHPDCPIAILRRACREQAARKTGNSSRIPSIRSWYGITAMLNAEVAATRRPGGQVAGLQEQFRSVLRRHCCAIPGVAIHHGFRGLPGADNAGRFRRWTIHRGRWESAS